jgi:hypothetical protein
MAAGACIVGFACELAHGNDTPPDMARAAVRIDIPVTVCICLSVATCNEECARSVQADYSTGELPIRCQSTGWLHLVNGISIRSKLTPYVSARGNQRGDDDRVIPS